MIINKTPKRVFEEMWSTADQDKVLLCSSNATSRAKQGLCKQIRSQREKQKISLTLCGSLWRSLFPLSSSLVGILLSFKHWISLRYFHHNFLHSIPIKINCQCYDFIRLTVFTGECSSFFIIHQFPLCITCCCCCCCCFIEKENGGEKIFCENPEECVIVSRLSSTHFAEFCLSN